MNNHHLSNSSSEILEKNDLSTSGTNAASLQDAIKASDAHQHKLTITLAKTKHLLILLRKLNVLLENKWVGLEEIRVFIGLMLCSQMWLMPQ